MADMNDDDEHEKLKAELKEEISGSLFKKGKVDWDYLKDLEKESDKRYRAAIRILIDKNILSVESGYFVYACGVNCNPRAIWGIETFFVREGDAEDYAENHLKDAQYSWRLAKTI